MIESPTEVSAQEGGSEKTSTRRATDQIEAGVRYLLQLLELRGLSSFGTWLHGLVRRIDLAAWFSKTLVWARGQVEDTPILHRYALHLVVVFLAAGVVLVSQLSLPNFDLSLPTTTPEPEIGEYAAATQVTSRGGNRLVGNSTGLFQALVPHTIIPERVVTEIISYTVQPNDNVWSIATGFGLQAETVVWANPQLEKAPDLLSVGQVLTILPVNGIYYTVKPGDTVEGLAKEFQTTAEKITSFELNKLEEPYILAAGQRLVIPDGRKKIVPSNYYPMTYVGNPPKGAPTGSGRFAWPAKGWLTQQFWSGHDGIDIGNATGTPILAADAGYVVLAGQETWGYGNQVLINHGNGFLTRYAHLHTILVKAGDFVEKGQKIGTMGSTGRSTGPHLHFEIIKDGIVRNPQGFLP